MPILPFNERNLSNFFSANYIAQGRHYSKAGYVQDFKISEDGRVLSAAVSNRKGRVYRVDIKIKAGQYSVTIDGWCSCAINYNCKHVAATLLQALQQIQLQRSLTKSPVLAHQQLSQWLRVFDQSLKTPENENCYPADMKTRLLYCLDTTVDHSGAVLHVNLVSTYHLKGSKYSTRTTKFYAEDALKTPPALFLRASDLRILRHFLVRSERYYTDYGHYPLVGIEAAVILEEMIQTGRCHWRDIHTSPLHVGDARAAELVWNTQKDGAQSATFAFSGTHTEILPITPPWFVDLDNFACGALNTSLPDKVAHTLLRLPEIPSELSAGMSDALTERFKKLQRPVAAPHKFVNIKPRNISPIAHLYLFSKKGKLSQTHEFATTQTLKQSVNALARLSFSYGIQRFYLGEQGDYMMVEEGAELFRIERNYGFENQALQQLHQYGLERMSNSSTLACEPLHRSDLSFSMEPGLDLEQKAIHFSIKHIPELKADGWQIEMAPDYLYRVVNAIDGWYMELNEENNFDWFNLQLGIDVDGKAINLLPILVAFIQKFPNEFTPQALTQLDDDFIISAPMDDGRLLPLKLGRVRSILSILIELYNPNALNEAGCLLLSPLDATRLSALEQTFATDELHWSGNEHLRQLGQRLRNFTELQPMLPPDGFKAILRPYQQDGLSWLQFLREFDLGGILADDMGLGKTIQTLAHLVIEKHSGRMTQPSIIIAPTSLMGNWRMEINRFYPAFSVLTLQGPERKKHFQKIPEYDIVLTTYPLLFRDHKDLLEHQFFYLILDEAQVIKNPKAQATQIAQQISAKHRLCLTGTPMENHLGELWSLFNFLTPGFLGDAALFRQLYRNPIEQELDETRRTQLSQRIKPFMLRRTKAEVASDLPPKTEILKTVEMDGEQRDLYESIRLAMHEKIRTEIADKGFDRSQIIILDALLKLRQVCCDPRLLRMKTAQNITQSAKLELLMDIVPEMVKAGRRILLFSQFTTMLEHIGNSLQQKSLAFVKLTGQTRDRETPIQRFQADEVPIFLISLKAGGTGLNLTNADTVIHYDPWWNPAVENQATDRAHRIGQDKSVFVYKLITAGTIEEKIIELQERKKGLLDGLFTGHVPTKSILTSADLEALFEPLPT